MIRCVAGFVLLCVFTAGVRGEAPPLTEAQRTSIAKLANSTKKEADRLKNLLDTRQEELAVLYAKYKLDEDKAKKLEDDVIALQRELLTNYRKMQVELRALVGEERFVFLRQRIDNMLKAQKK